MTTANLILSIALVALVVAGVVIEIRRGER